MFKLLSPLAGVASLFLASSVHAVSVTHTYNGYLDSVDNDNGVLFDVPISVGDSFSLTYTFDSEKIDEAQDNTLGSYLFSGAPYGIALSVGANSFFSDAVRLDVSAITDDSFNVFSSIYRPGTNTRVGNIVLSLDNPYNPVFETDALPVTIPNPSSFSVREFNLYSNYGSASGTVQAVPEPSEILGTVAVMAMGVYGYLRKRKTKPNAL